MGVGGLYVFVLDEEAESPITQCIYNTQTQFATGWLRSQLCFGGSYDQVVNLIETRDVGVTHAELTQVHPSNACTMQNLQSPPSTPTRPLQIEMPPGGTDRCTDMWTQLEAPP